MAVSRFFKSEDLQTDANCGFCGTQVKAGFSICPSCGARYGTMTKASQAEGKAGLATLGIFVGPFYAFLYASFIEVFYKVEASFGIFDGVVLLYFLWSLYWWIKNCGRTEKHWWKFDISM